MGGSGNLRAKQQRGAAVRKGKSTRRPAAPSASTPDNTSSPVNEAMDKGKVKQPDGSMIGYNALTKKVRCAGWALGPSRQQRDAHTIIPATTSTLTALSQRKQLLTPSPPSSIEIATSIRYLSAILSVSTKILRAATVENVPIVEAMPDIPGWFEGSKAVCQEVLDRYGGLGSAGGKVGEMVDMAVRVREALAEIEEGVGMGGKGRT